MPTSFKDLKKNRTKAFEDLQNRLESKNDFQNTQDEYWKLPVDKAGNGYAVIRFLPAAEGEEADYVEYWDHGWQGPGGWYIEKSRTTLSMEEPDPVAEYNRYRWMIDTEAGFDGSKNNSGPNQSWIRENSRRNHNFVARIQVVEDPVNPDNNGRVFKYRFGKVIYSYIQDAMNPRYPDQQKFNPFDMWEGAPLKLKAYNDSGFRKYDRTEWGDIEQLAEADAEIEAIWSQGSGIESLVDPETAFKPYVKLKERLERAMNINLDAFLGRGADQLASPATSVQEAAQPTPQEVASEDELPWDPPEEEAKKDPTPDDDIMAKFQELADMD